MTERSMSWEWGSDIAAEMLRRFDVEFIALNPGSSLRGMHDSLVNYLGDEDPKVLLCLHEDHCVAIAHGYAKATDQPMAVALHANVGLMHASLGIFNAWCDRVPMFIIGANGPFDATRRRPWMDWLHTTKDQGALVRNSVKWDDEPRSSAALIESMLRANKMMRTQPMGPVYVCLDVALQETRLQPVPELPEPGRYTPPLPPRASRQCIAEVAEILVAAERPVILIGRSSRSRCCWDQRVHLAELLNARIATDLKSPAAFPTSHPLHLNGLTLRISDQLLAAVRDSDVILNLDWLDSASLFAQAGDSHSAKIIRCSLDSYLHHGGSMEHFGLPPVDVDILSDPDLFVGDLLEVVKTKIAIPPGTVGVIEKGVDVPPQPDTDCKSSDIAPVDIAVALNALRDGRLITLARVPIGWDGDAYPFTDPLDFLGYDGGGGLSSGPGNTVGAALGLRTTDRIVVGILGDGDFLQASGALWTAARYRIPALFVISNNRSNYTDVGHQEHIAALRSRPVERSGIAQHIDEPKIDLAGLARANGVDALGPVTLLDELTPALEKGLEAVESGSPFLVDVQVSRS